MNSEKNETETAVETPEECGGQNGIEKYLNTFEIHTINEGYNAGRAYYLQVWKYFQFLRRSNIHTYR